MKSLIIAWLVAICGSILIECLTRPRSPILVTGSSAALYRLAVFTFILAFFFVWSWRPWFAAAATLILVSVFVAISVGKLRYTYEPLVFSDLAFVLDIFRHPTLFHTTFLGPLFLLAAIGAVAALIGFWFQYEAPLAASLPVRLAVAAAWLAVAAAPFAGALHRPLESWGLGIKQDPEIFGDLARHGLMATLVMDWLSWRGDDRGKRMASWSPPSPPIRRDAGREAADLIVVTQCESFLDFRRFDATRLDLPALDAARLRAISWGRLGSAFAGGYTMRSEFSFLVGRRPADIGFDRYYPYLNAGAYRQAALPEALSAAGYTTQFIHPFHRDFFQRHRAMPGIGFQRMTMLEDFGGAARVGAYVGDAAVAERVIAEAKAAAGPAFLFAATMENHEPWGAGRFDDIGDPVAVYKKHLQNGDALLGRLVNAFEDWPGRVVLAFYGDHVPLLKAFADPFPESDTDYVLLELGSRAPKRTLPTSERRLEVYELTWRVLAAAGLIDKVSAGMPDRTQL